MASYAAVIVLRCAYVFAQGGRVASRAIVMQRTTKRPVQFELTDHTREAMQAWIAQAKLASDHFRAACMRRRISPRDRMRK
jgi:hypothetical protein